MHYSVCIIKITKQQGATDLNGHCALIEHIYLKMKIKLLIFEKSHPTSALMT